MRNILFCIFLLMFCSLSLPLSSGQSDSSPLFRAFESFRSDNALDHASWGFYVKDISDDKEILAFNTDQYLVPASTQKVITTVSALMLLGHDFQYETHLEYNGQVDIEGVLHGNLYIRGSGDPSFGSEMMHDSLALNNVFEKWRAALRAAGIRKINGHIIADERIFDDAMVPGRWIWQHIGNYFGAGTSGLTVHENEYRVYFDAGSGIGQPATVVNTYPTITNLSFINEVTTGPVGSGDQVYIYGAPFVPERRLTGTVPLGAKSFAVRGSMPDPPLHAATSLWHFLNNQGVEVTGIATSYRNAAGDGIIPSENRTVITTWRSVPLEDIVYRTNLTSVNSFAESLLKTIGYNTRGEGSFSAGLKALEQHWDAFGIVPSLDKITDGSGLSPSNRITANQLMVVLDAAAKHPTFEILHNSLPIAGQSGSLANHLRGTGSEGILRAKSGFLNDVLAYSGYTTMQNGNLAAFVIIVNHYDGNAATMRRKILQLMDTITLHQ
ncbi:MAG: D-alanyl-D-alanine carboxypeptidase/D-alanyl-D-alanine-endopeptidase [Bacteroidia bacterium]|nr:MAG: D-alanyl-D-alanine carboxypeptidase/D-alanyl-D-alanine-endopeptidase [Bacteroidia bacterium]